ncbi:MAG: terminase ATPase subunit family protein [Agitococcus sp.]|nr:terminase ATPase subunit family protein [Agitococcus sp.]
MTTWLQELGGNRKTARALYWQGWSVSAIADHLTLSRSTIESWKQREHWDEVRPIDRVDAALETRMLQLIHKEDKDGKDFKEIDLLGRQLERLARVRRYEKTDNEVDLNPKVANRNKGSRKAPVKNEISDEAKAKIIEAFHDSMFGYQKVWYEAGQQHRIRNLLKSRQIGATYYFAFEAFVDALETGRNQIFLSASKAQAHVFKQYIIKFAKEYGDVDLKGDPIVLPNGATLYFLGTNARTAQSYHGNIYMDEYFWIHKFRDFRKVASGMAMHKKWRQTYISTPSSITHEAYPFWTGEHFNRGKAKEKRIKIDVSHHALAAGRLCEDGQWRQVVTVEDAVRGGCDLFDIEELRQEYSEDEFNNLLMCLFIDDTYSVFPLSELMGCMVDSYELWTDFKPYSSRPLGDREVWLGYDPQGSENGDNAALFAIAPPVVKGGIMRGIEKHQFKGSDFKDQAEFIRAMTKKYRVTYIAIDVTGIGEGVYQLVKEFFPAVVALRYSPDMKNQLILKAQDLIRSKRFQFDAGWTDVAAAFMAIKKTLTESQRQVTFTASRSEEGGHADLAWAAMHAMHKEPLAISGQHSKNIVEIYS